MKYSIYLFVYLYIYGNETYMEICIPTSIGVKFANKKMSTQYKNIVINL